MNSFENPFKKEVTYDLEDYEDASYYSLLQKLPPEIALKHIRTIEEEALNDDDARVYLTNVIEKRKEATTESGISDTRIEELLATTKKEFFERIETSVFASPDIGAGSTARIKHLELPGENGPIDIAVKYVVTPNPNTISPEAEHNMLREVERMRTIEALEEEAHVDLMRVPHPYFYHDSEKIHCYGMERIVGVNLKQATEGILSQETYEKLYATFSDIPEDTLYAEVEKFFEQMHKYCLHGDIKPANIMVSEAGKFYIIDFGQSSLVDNIPEEGRAGLDDRREFEAHQAKLCIQLFLHKLHEKIAQSLPKAA